MHASRQEMVWWTESNFLGLLPKTGNDQWDCEIGNYYVPSIKFVHLHLSIRTFFEWVGRKIFWSLLGYIVAKACASPRKLTWFTRQFLLIRGWSLGTRLLTVQSGGCAYSFKPRLSINSRFWQSCEEKSWWKAWVWNYPISLQLWRKIGHNWNLGDGSRTRQVRMLCMQLALGIG